MSEFAAMTRAQFAALDIIPRLRLAKDALVDDPILAQDAGEDAGTAIHVSDVITDAIIAIQRWRPHQPLEPR